MPYDYLLYANLKITNDNEHIMSRIKSSAFSIYFVFLTFVCAAQNEPIQASESVKKPWYIPALEITSINVLVNRFDLYVLGAEWADVNPTSWKNNFKSGFKSDGDSFNTNFFTHPYHGSLYFNSARSLGYSYWQSIPFVISGSLMWEFLGETEPPSEIDINTTTFGGIYLGEVTNRLTRALLWDDKVRPQRTLRNLGALVLNPVGQLNSWMYKDVRESFRSSTQQKFPIRAELSAGVSIPIKEIERVNANTRSIIYFQMLYGNIFERNNGFKPFDAFILKSWIDYSIRKTENRFFINITSHAPVYRHLIKDNFAFSVSQHYDFLENQVFQIGVMSITADLSFQKKYKSWGFAIRASLGIIPFGSSNSEVINYLNEEIEEEFYKEYVYGRGIASKIEYIIRTEKFGRLISTASHWYINTENFVQGVENTSVAKLRYDYPITKSAKLGLELLNYNRVAHYEEIPQYRDITESYVELKILFTKTM